VLALVDEFLYPGIKLCWWAVRSLIDALINGSEDLPTIEPAVRENFGDAS
jgi:hypothetical protein